MPRPFLFALTLLASCARDPAPPSAATRTPIPARGRVTSLAEHPPEVVPVAPATTVKAPPFVPVEDDGAMAHVEHFTTDDGLLMDDILCAYMDARGMLWFGTNGGGLSRYDPASGGKNKFTTYTMAHGLPDNVIMALGGDRHGNVWIGTSTGGLCKYDGHRFTTYNPANATGLGKGINCIVEGRDGTLWIGSRGHGVFRMKDDRWDVLPVVDPQGNDVVRDMAVTDDGSVWASTVSGTARYDGGQFNRVVIDGDPLRDVISILPEGDEGIWFARGRGLSFLNMQGNAWGLRAVELQPGEVVRVNHAIRAARNELWIASDGHGALQVKQAPGGMAEVQRISGAQGLGSDQVLCAVRDRHGDLWFGTRGAGLAHYRGPAFTYYRGIKPISIAEDPRGTLWFGTDRGIARFDPSTSPRTGGALFSEQIIGTGSTGWNYSVSIDPQGRPGFGMNMAQPGRHGISWLSGDTYHVISSPDDRSYPDIFWTMYDRRGRLWAGGRRGVELYADGKRTSFTTEHGLGSNLVLCIVEDRTGAIWIGTDGGGMSRIDTGSETGAGGTSVTTWTSDERLPNNVVWNIAEDAGGALWITTLAGLCRYDGRTFLTYTTKDGLPHDNVNAVMVGRINDGIVAGTGKADDGPMHAVQQARGDILIGTLSGLAIITGWKDAQGEVRACSTVVDLPNDSLAHYAPVIEVYNSGTGYPVKDVQTAEHTVFEDSKGVIWVSTGSDKTGLVRFDRSALARGLPAEGMDTSAITVQLTGVSINNEPTCWHSLDANADSATVAQQEAIVFGNMLSADERTRTRERYRGVSFSGIAPHFALPGDLVLDYRNNRIGFAFAGMETARPEAVEYQWMLEGYDEAWSPPTRTSTTSFGNMREGGYTFKVKAKSPDGAWSAPAEFHFTVLPPMHRTWWAFILYVVLIVGAILFFIRRRTAVLQVQKEKLERTVMERTEELRRKKEEADQQRGRAELSEKAKEQFLANMSHEIRTPMNAIMGMTGILQRNAHPPEQDRYLGAIKQSSDNLLVILNDILDMSKIDAGRIAFEAVPFEPRRVVENVKEILHFKAEEKKLALVVDVSPDVPTTLIGDPTRLNQIVLNLAGNAVKFTEHGSVTICVRCASRTEPDDRTRAGVRRTADRIVDLIVDVIDTGIGIPEDRLDKIFEEFTQAYSDTTRKYGGTGLGLTISKRLAELQGGNIRVTSARGEGSTFTVSVPYAIGDAAAQVACGSVGADDHPPLRDLRILLAEDNDFNVMVAQDELQDAIPGVRVDHAANGRIAVELATANDYDVILMDVQMPEMNGFDATRAIRALSGDKSRVPIIAMTANVMKAELDECLRVGMDAHVPKPFKREELVGAIARVLGR